MIRSRNFGPYFAGNAASASGTWFQNLAGSILVFRLTHSAFLLGVLAFCQFAPVLLLAPWAGSWADRFDRRKLLLGTQLARDRRVSGGLRRSPGTAGRRPWVVIGCSAALGVTSAVSAPAQQALIASLVERQDVAQAVALNSMTFNLARAIGPASAAAVIATLGHSVGLRAQLALVPRPDRRAAGREPAGSSCSPSGRRCARASAWSGPSRSSRCRC